MCRRNARRAADRALLIRNIDQRPKDYAKIAQSFRPGHADYTYLRT